MLAPLSRFPSLRLAARAVTLALIAFPLISLALAMQSNITHLSSPATVVLLVGFSLLLAATFVFVKWMFRTVP
jgi:hypothetical protein